jgi:hypothetical protein
MEFTRKGMTVAGVLAAGLDWAACTVGIAAAGEAGGVIAGCSATAICALSFCS